MTDAMRSGVYVVSSKLFLQFGNSLPPEVVIAQGPESTFATAPS